MNKKEFFAAVNLYKRQSEIVQWKNDFLPKAIAASAKEILAHSTGNDEDAMAFANELASYTKKLDWLPDSEFSKISSLIEHSAEEMAEKYGATFDDGVLEHGTKWKDHKYIRIENGRYIYPEDLEAKKLREDAAIQRKTSKELQGSAALSKYLLNNGKNSDGSPVKEDQELSKKLQRDYDQSKAWSAATQAQEKGMLRKAEELKAQADKKRFDATAANIAKVNEERKEAEAKKAAVRAKDDGSKNAAQSEGEAMQAWKNAKAAAEVRKGDNSAKNAQAEGEAYQKWKEQQAAKKAAEETKAIQQKKNDAYEARERATRKAALAEGAKETVQRMLENGSKHVSEQKLKEDSEKLQAEQNAYEANAKGAQRTKDILANREIQARAAEWNAKSQEERNKEISEYEKQIKSSRARMRVLAQFESDAAEYAKQHDAEVVMESYDPQTGYANKISVVKKNPGNGKHEEVINTFFIKSESYSDDDWINQAKQDGLSEKVEEDWKREKEEWDKRVGFKHSSISPLSKDEYYAAIEAYKRKRSI